MVELDVSDWNAFGAEVGKLRIGLGKHAASLLFRGQSDSDWRLATTLERAGCDGMSFVDYYRLVTSTGPAVETFAGIHVPNFDFEIEKSFQDLELFSLRRFPPNDLYSYMVYLRHHGFPSPLLDWSYSPYVAAFFAFRNQSGGGQKRSIYAYCEMPEGHKGGAVGEPTIRQIGPYVRSHRRHFRQQSDYTICGSFNGMMWCFHPHETVFGSRPAQDTLWKFNLPSTERLKILSLLNEYNLNAFSLFDSEESLLETMWFREHILKKRDPQKA